MHVGVKICTVIEDIKVPKAEQRRLAYVLQTNGIFLIKEL
jgi:hypothetical protein